MAGSGPFSSFGVAGQRAGHERFIGVYLRPIINPPRSDHPSHSFREKDFLYYQHHLPAVEEFPHTPSCILEIERQVSYAH